MAENLLLGQLRYVREFSDFPSSKFNEFSFGLSPFSLGGVHAKRSQPWEKTFPLEPRFILR